MSKIDTAWERTKSKDFLRIPRQLNHPIRERIVEETVGNSVLDVGCASAIQYPFYKDSGIEYTGVDFTQKFLNYAWELYGDIDLVYADASDIPRHDRCFSTVFCKDLLEHLPPDKYKEVLSEMWRLTDKRMMIALYIKPWGKSTEYLFVKNIHYKNTYDRLELMLYVSHLEGFKECNIISDIGFNNSELWIVDKYESK